MSGKSGNRLSEQGHAQTQEPGRIPIDPMRPETMAPKLKVSHLGKAFDELVALQDINLAVERGEFISVVGPSGCGKTTFLRIVAGLERATSGEVLLDGRAVHRPGTDRGFVFQNDSLLPWRTVFANAIIGREVAGRLGAAERRRTMELLKLVGLEGFENYHPRQLSGGMRQRVNLARAPPSGPPARERRDRAVAPAPAGDQAYRRIRAIRRPHLAADRGRCARKRYRGESVT